MAHKNKLKTSVKIQSFHCANHSCDMCDRYIKNTTLNQSDINKQFVNWRCSNFQKRLICLLVNNGLGKVYKQKEIIEFVWNDNGLEAKAGSVNQIIHQTKKELSSKWDIGNFRGKGYFLYPIDSEQVIIKL